jgi:glycosyltransferase involved in cell wall biosynthesis
MSCFNVGVKHGHSRLLRAKARVTKTIKSLTMQGEGQLEVHVVLPCLNEEHVLPGTLQRLCAFLHSSTDWNWHVTVVDNGSTDGTSNVTRAFALVEGRVSLMRLEARGRGRALRAAWLNNTAQIQSYMDVDLSTDLSAFPALVRYVANASADVAVASRNVPGAHVQGRSALRSLTSKGLSLLIRCLFWRFRVRDTQCGCKVLTLLM